MPTPRALDVLCACRISAPHAAATRRTPGRPRSTETSGVPRGIAAAFATAPPKPAAPVASRLQAALCTVKSSTAEYASAAPPPAEDTAASKGMTGPSVSVGMPLRVQLFFDCAHAIVLQSDETVPTSKPMFVKVILSVSPTSTPVPLPYTAVVDTLAPT